jgi:hypothetical protein
MYAFNIICIRASRLARLKTSGVNRPHRNKWKVRLYVTFTWWSSGLYSRLKNTASLVSRHKCFGRTYCFHLQVIFGRSHLPWRLRQYVLWNVGTQLPYHTVSSSSPWKNLKLWICYIISSGSTTYSPQPQSMRVSDEVSYSYAKI